MAEILRNHPLAITYSIALHAVIAAALMLGFDFSRAPRGMPQATAIQARVVDESAIRREMERIETAEREKEEKARRDREQQRLAEERRKREESDRVEQERQEQLRVQREQAAQLQREREAEAQREREAQAQREREEEERRAEQRRREEEARRQAEARKQAEVEAELARALAAEDEARRAEEAGLLDQYLRAIHDKIQRNWSQPLSARPGLECVINVTQIPSGDVVGVSFGRCNGDEAVKRSIEAAVQRASPLPRPPVQSLFNRSLEVTFKPEV
jgi:colicin import membrane protein